MKLFFTLLIIFVGLHLSAQLNQKTIEKADGRYTYTYHKNGKESTVEFYSNSSQYMAQGYSKAFDKTGKLIYEQTTSRTGMLSGVRYSYYENGAVKSAEYSAHPDAGIQWYKKYTYFDENGVITNEMEMSDDMRVTTFAQPDTALLNQQKQKEKYERQQKFERENIARNQFIKDSTLFFSTDTTYLENDTLLIIKPNSENNSREYSWLVKNRVVKSKTEFFQKTSGIIAIERTYHKNGLIAQEIVFEKDVYHKKLYNKKGRLTTELLNQTE